MSAYLIGHMTVKNEDKWSEYRRRVPATLELWGGRMVFRGHLAAVLAGVHNHTDTVVIQFADQRALRGWYDSPAYQGLIPLRTEAADIVLISYDE